LWVSINVKNVLSTTFKGLFSSILCLAVCVACSGSNNNEAGESNLDSVGETGNNSVAHAASDVIDTLLPSAPAGLPAAASAAIEYAAHLYVAQSQGATELQVTATARFHHLTTPLDDAPVLQDANNLDTCEIGSERSQLNAEALDLPIDHIISSAQSGPIQSTTVNAGDTIELDADTGSYVTLVVDGSSTDEIEYKIQEGSELNVALPEQLNVTAAGDEFPALQWQWSTPDMLDVSLRSAIRSIDANPALTWQAPQAAADGSLATSQSKLLIHAGSIDELTGEFRSFQCELSDDGEFTVPDDVQALYANGFNANFVDVVRTTRTLSTDGATTIVNVFVQQF